MRSNPFLMVIALVFILFDFQQSQAQSNDRKVEVGAQFSVLKVTNDQEGQFSLVGPIADTLVGGGVRVGYNISDNLSVETEANVFTRPSNIEGRRSQGFLGVKWGRRSERLGLFAKGRPGIMRFNRIQSFARDSSTNVETESNVYFALDVGGVAEVYPSKRSIVRFDFGDTIIRYSNLDASGFEPGANPVLQTNYGHNFQFSVGIGFRF